MNIENIRFKASKLQPNHIEVDYWIDLNADPNGGIIKHFNGTAWSVIKGSSEVDPELQQQITQIQQNITKLQFGKVDKDGDKVLSEVSFTKANQTKLEGIEENATNTIIVDNLTTSNASQALSAAQGKTLKDALDALTSRVAALEAPAA